MVFATSLALASSAAAIPLGNATSAAAVRPNIVWIMADDMGWGEPGLYPSESPNGRISTPHLDAFGRDGMVFTNAYAG
jgi:arylsulfatase A